MAEVRIREASPLTLIVRVGEKIVAELKVPDAAEPTNTVVLDKNEKNNTWRVRVKGSGSQEIEPT